MTGLAESFLLIDGDESYFAVPDIEDYEISGNFESPTSLSPPIQMNHPGKQMCADFSDIIDANFRKRMESDPRKGLESSQSASDFTFTQTHRPTPTQTSLLRKAFSPEQLAFQRRSAARKAAKLNSNRRAMSRSEGKDPSTPLEPFICIW